MKFLLNFLLSTFLFLSSQSISMEIDPEQHNTLQDAQENQAEEGFHYFPLFRVNDREARMTTLYFNVVFEMPNDLIPFLSTSGGQCAPCLLSTAAYVYLKVSELAMKELNNIASGNLPEGLKLVNQSYWFTPRFETQAKHLLNLVGKGLSISYLKGLEKSISALAFDRPLPSEKINSAPSLWTLGMSPRSMNLLRLYYPESYCETGKIKSCDIGSLLSFDPFDLETDRGTISAIKIMMYPEFDFVEPFSHIKDILLINKAGMLYIDNSSLQGLHSEVIELIIKTYSSIVQDEFNKTMKMLYQTQPENIKYEQ